MTLNRFPVIFIFLAALTVTVGAEPAIVCSDCPDTEWLINTGTDGIARSKVEYRFGQAVQASFFSTAGTLCRREFYTESRIDSVSIYNEDGFAAETQRIRYADTTPSQIEVIKEGIALSFTDLGKMDSLLQNVGVRSEEHINAVVSRNQKALNAVVRKLTPNFLADFAVLPVRLSIRPDGIVDRAVVLTKTSRKNEAYNELLRIVYAMQFDPCSDNCGAETVVRTITFAPDVNNQPEPAKPHEWRTRDTVLAITGVVCMGALVAVYFKLDKSTKK